MSANSKIEWCEHTFNPIWGCIEVSPACDNCYARTFANRVGQNVWGPAATTERRTFGDKHWAEPLKWNRDAEAAGTRARVFCASMADVFEQHPTVERERQRLWPLITSTPHLDWLLLTKRPQNITRMVPKGWLEWPPFNVWYGTTVENQHYADQRIPILLDVPAAVRFLSMEPLLGPVNLLWHGSIEDQRPTEWLTGRPRIDWVITGGESGHGSRPADPNWYRSLRDQCEAAVVAFHFKQWGDFDEHGKRVGKKAAGRLLDGRTWDEFPAPRPAGPAAEGVGA